MTEHTPDSTWLAGAAVDSTVFQLRPDYRAVLVLASNLVPGPSDASSERMLVEAEGRIKPLLAQSAVEDLPEIAAWRDAYRAFGAKPQRTRPSVEAMVRRVDDGLPRIDRITDTYNAISVAHLLPLGGEDADKYIGPARLLRATGDEEFDTFANGEAVVEHPEVGEVIWTDEAGVTCRRWNWRQPLRTRISEKTTNAFFIIDGLLEATPQPKLIEAADELQQALASFSPDATFLRRIIEPEANHNTRDES